MDQDALSSGIVSRAMSDVDGVEPAGFSAQVFKQDVYKRQDVSFLAASSYTGIVSIDYTGRSSEGETFSGVVEIQVDSAGGNTTIDIHLPFRDISSSAYYFDAVKWAVSAGITSCLLYTSRCV